MSLMLAHISKFGIILATDSNLTSNTHAPAGQAKKIFPVPYLKAGLTVAGSYSVNGTKMDDWMEKFIELQTRLGTAPLGKFSEELRTNLEEQLRPKEKDCGCIMHVAGYAEQSGVHHPEFWYVRNVYSIDPRTGEYGNILDKFKVSEDFWKRDCPKKNLMRAFQSGTYQTYINGFASGRIAYVAIQPVINDLFSGIWQNQDWKFRPPRSIQETEVLVRLNMQIIGTLFLISDYSAPFIGGDIQTHVIAQPMNTATEC